MGGGIGIEIFKNYIINNFANYDTLTEIFKK